MPQRFAMRRFKAAIFTALSYPATSGLSNAPHGSCSRLFILRECFKITEDGAHDYQKAFTRLLDDPFLQQAIVEFGERHSLAMLFSQPLRIEILEHLCERDLEEDELIEELPHEEQARIMRDLDILVYSTFVHRWREGGMVWYGIKETSLRTVLALLRETFENNLLDALILISDVSCERIHEAMAQLKNRLQGHSGVFFTECNDDSSRRSTQ